MEMLDDSKEVKHCEEVQLVLVTFQTFAGNSLHTVEGSDPEVCSFWFL
jgi:hypothetical protein